MFDDKADYFVFVPSGKSTGTLHKLKPAHTFQEPGFVVIPYANPALKPVKPMYFSITAVTACNLKIESGRPLPFTMRARTSKADYIKRIGEISRHIMRGDIYEINYCISFEREDQTIDPLQVFMTLYDLAKAPHMMLVRLLDKYIICASPELFIKKTGSNLITRPIKGTARRSADADEDAALKDALYNSVKERTENVMAVDVARNDLSMIAARGTVAVNRLYNIETFETVHQMVSTVSCTVRHGITFDETISAAFPMASMTGAPKKSAMNIISRVEDFERGFYSGAMGFVKDNGDYELAVVIRSAFYDALLKKVSLAVGGAITYLSDAEEEYNECRLKASAMLRALNATIDSD